MSIYQKRVSVGSFLKKGEDVKDGDLVIIGNEGKEVEGNFGSQNLFLVKTSSGKEGNVAFNRTSINSMIDAYGSDSKNWIGKQAKVWAILSNVQGKMIKVYYFTHPQADIDEDGNFNLPKAKVSTPISSPTPQNMPPTTEAEDIAAFNKLGETEPIKLEDIPFV